MSDDPMDQDNEDNDEFFSARETQRRLDPQRSDRETAPARVGADSSPSDRKLKASKRSTRQQNFVADEKALHSDKSGKLRQSEKQRREKNKWDRRDYKKEELAVSPPRKENKKKIKPKRVSTEEASKTDEESEVENPEAALTRPYFKQHNFVLSSRMERPVAPKCNYRLLRFKNSQEIVEFDGVGDQVQHNKYTDRAITNPWRKWGAHRTLCEQGGTIPVPNKPPMRVERGSPFPPCPPDACQVTLNKNSEIPNSQSLFGSIRVQPGAAVPEAHRIGLLIEETVANGGFKPKQAVKNRDNKGQPIVVVVMQKGKKKKKSKEKKKKKKGDKKAASSSTDSSDDATEEESGGSAEKVAKKAKNPPPKAKDPEVKDDSKKGGGGGAFAFFFRHPPCRRNKSPKKQPPKASGSKDPRRKPPKGKS